MTSLVSTPTCQSCKCHGAVIMPHIHTDAFYVFNTFQIKLNFKFNTQCSWAFM